MLAFRPFSLRWELSLKGKATPSAVGRLGLELNVTLLVLLVASSGEGGSDVMIGTARWLRSPDVALFGVLLFLLGVSVEDVSSSLALLLLLLVCPASVTVCRRDLDRDLPCCSLSLGGLAVVPSVLGTAVVEGSLSAFSSRVICHTSANERFDLGTQYLTASSS